MIRKELVRLVERQEPGIQVKESVCTRASGNYVPGFRIEQPL